jgi:hypothetical protein
VGDEHDRSRLPRRLAEGHGAKPWLEVTRLIDTLTLDWHGFMIAGSERARGAGAVVSKRPA